MKRLTTEEFISKAKLLHGDKYDYSNVTYEKATENVEIICRKHGSFFQLPYNHLKGHGCILCNKYELRRMKDFVSRSRKIHGDKYDYSKVEYSSSKTPVEIICDEHGSFFQKPEKHLIGHGCPYCCKNHRDTTESFVKKARKVHGDRYDYSKVEYVDQHTKVCIIDPVYGEFWQQPISHLNGRDCYSRRAGKCYITKKKNHSFNTSKAAEKMKIMLEEKFGKNDVQPEYKSSVYPFSCDFYIKSLDLYIELNAHVTHGGHWFNCDNVEDQNRLSILKERSGYRNLYSRMITVWTEKDLKKRDTAIKNNLNYVVFWDNDLLDFFEWYNSEEIILRRI